MSQLIELRDLWIATSERDLVKGIDVDIFPEQVTALCGPSGSGKSLTARAMMSVLDVSPGLQSGSLRYPTIDPKKDWFQDVVGKGMTAQKRLLKQTQHLRGHFLTYSPQSASSALNPGRTIGRQMEMAIARRETPPASLSKEILRILGAFVSDHCPNVHSRHESFSACLSGILFRTVPRSFWRRF